MDFPPTAMQPVEGNSISDEFQWGTALKPGNPQSLGVSKICSSIGLRG